MGRSELNGKTFARACFVAMACATLAIAHAQSFRTTSFNAKLKINNDRTLTVDETITIVPGGQALANLVLAEAPTGSHKLQFLVSRATVGAADLPIKTLEDKLEATLPAGQQASPLQVHLNYSVLGAFTDRGGGSLGNRSTLSWNLIPTSWPSAIESSQLEVEYPDKSIPLYIGANMGVAGTKSAIEKTQNTAFSGKLDAFNVSEGSNGITMQPPSGIAANAGMHLLIAISKKDLHAAPAKLGVTKPAPAVRGKPSNKPYPVPAATVPVVFPKEPNTLLLLLPLFPPVMFFFLYLKRFSFLRGRSFPTSAVPEGLGPAEAGYILEGSLKARHVIGALSTLAAGDLSKHGSATVDQDSIGPVEKRALEIIKRRSSTADPKQLNAFLSGSMQDLEAIAVQNLDAQDLLYPSSKRGKIWPAISLVLALAIAGYFAFEQEHTKGLIFAGLGVVLGALLVFSLSPLTQKGVRVHQKVVGLNRFLTAHSADFKEPGGVDYLEHLRPYAIAFGIAKEA